MAGVGNFLSGLAGGMQAGMSIKDYRKKQVLADTSQAQAPQAQQAAQATAQQGADNSQGGMGLPTSHTGYQQPGQPMQVPAQEPAQAQTGQSWGFLSSLFGGGTE